MKSENFKAVGERIRKVRKDAGLTLVAFAERLSSNDSYLSRVENGKQRASHQLITAIRDDFGVSVGWLYAGESSEIREPAGDDYSVNKLTDQSDSSTSQLLTSKAQLALYLGRLLLQQSMGTDKSFGYVKLSGLRIRLAAAREDALVGTQLMEIVRDDNLWSAAGEPNGPEFEFLRGYFEFGGDRTLEQWMECLRFTRWVRECVSLALSEEESAQLDNVKSA